MRVLIISPGAAADGKAASDGCAARSDARAECPTKRHDSESSAYAMAVLPVAVDVHLGDPLSVCICVHPWPILLAGPKEIGPGCTRIKTEEELLTARRRSGHTSMSRARSLGLRVGRLCCRDLPADQASRRSRRRGLQRRDRQGSAPSESRFGAPSRPLSPFWPRAAGRDRFGWSHTVPTGQWWQDGGRMNFETRDDPDDR
jgi:hypothetical protein